MYQFQLSQYTPTPSRVLMIDEAYLKQTTPINDNVDPKMLISAIQVAQDKHILFICGSGVYAELKAQIASNTLTTLNKSLLENYCMPTLAWWAAVEALPNIMIRIQNKGLEIKHSENSDSANSDDLIFLTQKYEDTAKYYARMLINYLKRNNELYPLYYNQDPTGSNVDTVYGVATEYFSGLVVPTNLGDSLNNIAGLGVTTDVFFIPKR